MISSPETPKSPNAFALAWRNHWFRLVVFGLAAAAAFHFMHLVSSVIGTFIMAYVVAYVANPMLNWLGRHRVSRGIGVLIVLVGFLVVGAVVVWLFTTIATQLIDLVRQIPTLVINLDRYLDRATEWLLARGVPNVETLRANADATIQSSISNIANNIVPTLQRALEPNGALISSITSIGSVLGRVFLVLLLSVYLMLDYSSINRSLLSLFPVPWQPRILEFSTLASTAIGGYVRGQIIIACFIGLAVGLGLSLLGIPNSVAIGFLAGMFNIVPYLGPIIGAVPAVALALPMGAGKVVMAILVFVIANQIESTFLSPMVLSKNTDLHPATVLISILVGALLFGFVGALVAVPLVALGKLLMQHYYYPSKLYQDGP